MLLIGIISIDSAKTSQDDLLSRLNDLLKELGSEPTARVSIGPAHLGLGALESTRPKSPPLLARGYNELIQGCRVLGLTNLAQLEDFDPVTIKARVRKAGWNFGPSAFAVARSLLKSEGLYLTGEEPVAKEARKKAARRVASLRKK